jgi:RNA polymerase sigma factor (sigma-70 family)
MSFSDTDLITRVLLDDDRNAFGELVRRYQSEVRHFLRRLTKMDISRADDLSQETFIKAYRSISKFRGRAKFSSWLYRIAHNTFLNDCRKRRELLTSEGEFDHFADESIRLPKGLVSDVDDALSQLELGERAVFDLYYRKGMTHSETAEALELPLGTVKTHLSRGKEKLRTLLKDWKTDA